MSYSWEFVTSLDFEWDFISGKKKFRWPAVSNDQILDVDELCSWNFIADILLCGTILFADRPDRDVRELFLFVFPIIWLIRLYSLVALDVTS